MNGDAAIILAGGEGSRLRALTRRLAGDDRPKQFCAVLGGETLLDQTRRRAARLVAPARTAIVVSRAHDAYWQPALAGVDRANVVVQPEGRGTAAAVLYALLRLQALAPHGAVALLPSDHWVSDDEAFVARVDGALDAARDRSDAVILMGVEADRPETGYGWIEPGQPILGPSEWPLYRVHRFVEKPTARLAERLFESGALWNSFVIVASAGALERLIRRALPELAAGFAPLAARIGTPWEPEVAGDTYVSIPSADLSRDVLQPCAGQLAVMPLGGVAWNDLGEPARVQATLARMAWAGATA